VTGLFIEGAIWPDTSDIMATPGAVSRYLGGVEGVSGGGWMEPKAGSGSSFDTFELPRFQPLPIALLECNQLLVQPTSTKPPTDKAPPAASADKSVEVDAEAEAEMWLQAAPHEWRVEAVADIQVLEESPVRQTASISGPALLLEGGAPSPQQSQPAESILDVMRDAPNRTNVEVPLYCCGDRTVPLCTVSLPAALRKGAVPWSLANPALFLQTE
jgi:hypothetical protein